MKILGISAFYHDSAVALIDDGKIISCIQEERISRKKNDHRFPANALKKILERKAKLTRTDNDIRKAANTWSKNPIDAEQKYGHISDWNTSNVTDMHQLFDNNINFNEDISKWDTSNVTNMNYMFSNASDFNQDISEWNVSKVTTMIAMFKDATNFKQDLNKWNPTNLDSVFSGNLNYTFRNTNKKFKIPDWYKKATAY